MSAVIDKHFGPNITPRYIKLTSGVMIIEPKTGSIERFKKIIETIINKRLLVIKISYKNMIQNGIIKKNYT